MDHVVCYCTVGVRANECSRVVKLLASANNASNQGTKSALPGVDPRKLTLAGVRASKQVALIIRAANSVRLVPDVVAVDLPGRNFRLALHGPPVPLVPYP